MILVALGTQDKSFHRLLEEIDHCIKTGVIKEEVIVQAGHTKYESSNMKIFDLIPKDEFEELVEKCDLMIVHGGVGSIFDALKRNKKVIAVPRLAKYNEHTNDHQLQIVDEFSKEGYILGLLEMKNLASLLKKVNKFKPKTYKSNTKNMVELIDKFIEQKKEYTMLEKIKGLLIKYKELILYLIFGVLTTLVNIVTFYIFDQLLGVNTYVSNTIAWFISVAFAYVTNKLFVFESKSFGTKLIVKEVITFFGFRLISYGTDMLCMYLMVDIGNISKMLAKVLSNIQVIISNYIFSKMFTFKKVKEEVE